jgi:DNA replication protein DnaC
MITTQQPATSRTCDDCGQLTTYEPLLAGKFDLLENLPHFCTDCANRRQQAESEAAAARIREKREAAWTSTIPRKYRETDTSHPRFPKSIWKSLRTWPLDRSLGLIGPSGRGKTRLLALLAKRAIADDLYVGWCPATSFQWAAQNQWDDEHGHDAKKWLRRWQDCHILFLDDLGKHRWTEAVESEFFALIDLRTSRSMPILWTMNPLPEDEPALVERLTLDVAGVISRALDPTGAASARPRFAPIVSRLLDGTETIPVLFDNP